jgi:hypothetical protein
VGPEVFLEIIFNGVIDLFDRVGVSGIVGRGDTFNLEPSIFIGGRGEVSDRGNVFSFFSTLCPLSDPSCTVRSGDRLISGDRRLGGVRVFFGDTPRGKYELEADSGSSSKGLSSESLYDFIVASPRLLFVIGDSKRDCIPSASRNRIEVFLSNLCLCVSFSIIVSPTVERLVFFALILEVRLLVSSYFPFRMSSTTHSGILE